MNLHIFTLHHHCLQVHPRLGRLRRGAVAARPALKPRGVTEPGPLGPELLDPAVVAASRLMQEAMGLTPNHPVVDRFSITKTIQLLGIPHSWRSLQMVGNLEKTLEKTGGLI